MNTKKEYKNGVCFRPYNINGFSISSIIFFSNGKEDLYINSGWVEHDTNDLQSIFINEVVRANKVNLNRKDNFILKTNNERKTYTNEKEYILYINTEAENINISEEKEIFYHENETEKTYKIYREIKVLKYTIRKYEPKTEKWEVVESEEVIKQTTQHKDKLKPYGHKINKIVEYLKENDIKTYNNDEFNKYTIQHLLKVYDKIKKVVEE